MVFFRAGVGGVRGIRFGGGVGGSGRKGVATHLSGGLKAFPLNRKISIRYVGHGEGMPFPKE